MYCYPQENLLNFLGTQKFLISSVINKIFAGAVLYSNINCLCSNITCKGSMLTAFLLPSNILEPLLKVGYW